RGRGFRRGGMQNLLRKMDQRGGEVAGLAVAPALAKAKGWEGEAPFSGEVVAEDGLADWLTRNRHAVVGATVYACLKARKKTGLEGFDLVVVDEASQVRVAEASVPVHLVAPAGRLVLAGDDLQLPPVVQGAYP